jgi:hypothetical protein
MLIRVFVLLIIFSIACGRNNASDNNIKLSASDSAYYLLEGAGYVKKTADSLSAILRLKIQEEGAENAISFCNTEAIHLTSIHNTHKINIDRLSIKNRNPGNAPSDWERIVLEEFQEKVLRNESLIPMLRVRGQNVHFLSPIFIQPMCLMCHGSKNEIAIPVQQAIERYYPKDGAMGYRIGEFRGMWRVSFNTEGGIH